MSSKGFVPKSKKILAAPPELRDIPKPQEEALDTKPLRVTIGMFQKKEKVAVPAKPVAVAKPVPAKPVAVAKPVPAKPAAKPPTVIAEPETMEIPPEEPIEEEELVPAPGAAEFEDLPDDLGEMAQLILEEERRDPYEAPPPEAYVPESRRGFSKFIVQTYNEFTLEAAPGADKTPPGEKYPYQKFVREYMRQASPYRGVLVYHGLGSGKTCTAIATSEALFSTARKKIIVMTPFSLRKNFLKEISLCGFRHFRLKNYWVRIPKEDPAATLFATTILGIPASHLRTASGIWVPDFRKSDADANYSQLDANEQTEIRAQILSILVWDKKKNPEGRIRFINYNGISAKNLQEIACSKEDEKFFDNAVIVVDEIHNLVRLMQGTIEPYLTPLKGVKRLIPLEEIGAERWKPTLCNSITGKQYARGYLFYRLLLDAKNSKIVGLSGTPLINFPEELGILMNVLHGYIPTIEGTVNKVGGEAQRAIQEIALANPYVDFVEVTNDPGGRGTLVTLTLLPYGVRKVSQDKGVERIPIEETPPTFEECVKGLVDDYAKEGLELTPTLKALPLLPPVAQAFRDAFVTGADMLVGAAQEGRRVDLLKNDIVLLKRMTGLVSYYKGSREDLMPAVVKDEVVRVPMSLYSQRMYSEARKEEIMKEKKPKAEGGLSGVWAEVYDVGKGKQSSNYKMASRQACNFTFPPEVVRPKARTRAEQMAEAMSGATAAEDIVDTAPDSDQPRDAEEFPELETGEEVEAERREAEQAAADDLEAEADVAAAVAGPVVEGAADTHLEQAGGADEDETEPATQPATQPAKPKKSFIKQYMEQKAAQLKADCKVGTKPGEKYMDACKRAKECLAGPYADMLRLDTGEAGLAKYSPKFAAMLERIAAAPGSSLVYSQFLDMEGIGIFRLAMDANGYAPIEILSTGGQVAFSKRTLESFAKGADGKPSTVPRYITFSGGEDEQVRRYALDIFNANLDELPEALKTVLQASGYENNHAGQICRVFCITSAGAEGLSLKCVRAVHIMEPYWNDVRLKQVKGRAIRIGSHLELPESERNVSIYTYISCFSEEAQLAKSGDGRIDETIRIQDKLDKKDAVALGLPLPVGATMYVLTTDERLHVVAERKKAITNALEGLMKAGAVDCNLNVSENKVLCQSLEGAVGDFLYHPDLAKDITESASKYGRQAAAPAAAAAAAPTVTVAPVPKGFVGKVFRKKKYWMKETADGFDMYLPNDIDPAHIVIKTGKTVGPKGEVAPAPPIKVQPWAKEQKIEF